MKIASVLMTVLSFTSSAFADTLVCDLSGYKPVSGLSAAVANNSLTVTWSGDRDHEVRLRFVLNGGVPTIEDLAIRRSAGAWTTIAAGAHPSSGLFLDGAG